MYIIPSSRLYSMMVVLFLFFSCHEKENKDRTVLSPKARIALAKADTLANGRFKSRSISYLDSVYASCQECTLKDIFEKYKFKAVYFLNIIPNDTSKVRLVTDSMLNLLRGRESLYENEYTATLFIKGDLKIAEKNYNEALEYYYDAFNFSEKHLDVCQHSSATLRLGSFFFSQERYYEAIPYIRKAYEESASCLQKNVDHGHLQVYSLINTLALSYERSGQLDSAEYYYQEALSSLKQESTMMSKTMFESARGVILGNLGGTYSKLKRTKEAERLLKTSISINDKPGMDTVDAQTAKLKLVDLYLNLGHFDDAKVLLDQLQGYSLEKLTGIQMSQASRLKLLKLHYLYFSKIKDTDKAYQSLYRYDHFRDSVMMENKSFSRADLTAAFESRSNEHKLLDLAREIKLERAYISILVIFFLMAASILAIIWRNQRRLRLLNSQITIQNERMSKLLRALEDSQEQNTRMIHLVAHDLRNPIAATITIAELLDTTDLSQKDKDMVAVLKNANQRSLELIANLLAINADKNDLRKHPVELHTLLAYCINLFRFKADEKQQELKAYLLDATICFDGGKMWRVFSNLISNAIKFSPAGAAIKISMEKKNESIIVAVHDAGIGIPSNLKNELFEFYTRAKRKGTFGEHSYGLGLAISRQIVTAHEGRIWFESIEGKGSTFFIELPHKS